MNMSPIFSLFFLISVSSGTSVPALIWSPNRPLSDLPDVFAGHSVSSADFHTRYLKPLSAGATSALVIFVQDRLSLDDFTHYADVYNPESNGGAFQNIKDFMDEQFSVQLPQVVSPLSALDALRKTYAGRVHELEAPYDISELPLSSEQGNLVVVHLPKTKAGSEEQSIANNDKLIGKVLVALGNRGVKYTAIYTAQASSEEESEPLKYSGRHLLETTPESGVPTYNQSIFVNGTCGFLYALALQMMGTSPDKTAVARLTEAKLTEGDECGNFSEPLVWTISFGKVENSTIKDVELTLNFTVRPNTQNNDWYIADAEMSYTGEFWANDTSGVNVRKFKGQEIWAPRGLSYHCSNPSPIMELSNSSTNLTLRFTNLQLQPFGIRNGKFGLAWDCVGFFTAPIWMALFSILVLLLILAYGLSMILNINVMDRFDDAKGKTIVINAQE